MKKTPCLVLFYLLLCSAGLSAETKQFRFLASISATVSMSDDYIGGVGGRFEFSYRILPNLCLGASLGTIAIFPTDDWTEKNGYEYRDQIYLLTPLMATVTWLILPDDFRPFLGAGIGLVHAYEYYEYDYVPYGWRKVEVDKDHFGFEPMAGFEIDFGKWVLFSTSLRYLVVGERSGCFSFTVGIGAQF